MLKMGQLLGLTEKKMRVYLTDMDIEEITKEKVHIDLWMA